MNGSYKLTGEITSDWSTVAALAADLDRATSAELAEGLKLVEVLWEDRLRATAGDPELQERLVRDLYATAEAHDFTLSETIVALTDPPTRQVHRIAI